MPVLENYLRSTVKLKAIDNLNDVMVGAVGSGSLEKEVAESTIKEWEEQAGIKRKKKKVRVSKDGPELLGSMGIAVEVREKKTEE